MRPIRPALSLAALLALSCSTHGEADAARRAGEIGQRQRGRAGHGVVKATNGGGWQRLGQCVCGLVGSRDVDEAEGAGVDHLVAKAVVAGVDVGALAAVAEDVGAEFDAGLVVFEKRGGLELGVAEVAEEGAQLQSGAAGVVGGVVLGRAPAWGLPRR